jgi:TetR/AcrR family transcriptional regulator, transcriptional repressor for nem operon
VARPRKFDERAIVDAVREQFWTTGYAGTTMDELARITGLGKGSLYGAFGTKRELFHRVFDEYCAAIVTASEARLSGDDEHAFERLRAHVRAIAASTAADTGRRGCLLAKAAAELSEHDAAVVRRSRETIETLRGLLEADIAACQRNGDLAPEADPAKLAALLLTVGRGIEAVGKAGGDGQLLADAAETALAVLPRPSV